MYAESEIFDELISLCSSKGYAHVIASFCFSSNMSIEDDTLTSHIMAKLFYPTDRMRWEITILIGLLAKNEIDLFLPIQTDFQEMIKKTHSLFEEMRICINRPLLELISSKHEEIKEEELCKGEVLREPMLYGAESATDFQYLDFSVKKYSNDNDWLKQNKGFFIEEAQAVVASLIELQKLKNMQQLNEMLENPPEVWTLFPGFLFTISELTEFSNIDSSIILSVIEAFSIRGKNEKFLSLSSFNAINGYPVQKLSDGTYLLFQHYNLLEALYEAPFYWMNEDEDYVKSKGSKNRGAFPEKFSEDRLKLVFSKDKEKVFLNARIIDPKKPKVGKKGEADVLVVFGDRAIILQAKAKRLTLEARNGNDDKLKSDFESIKKAYKQGVDKAKLLIDGGYKVLDVDENEIKVEKKLKEIYILCVVPDHYPALIIFAKKFLKLETTDVIKSPLILDLFALDIITEMLQSPLHFLSYLNKRTQLFKAIDAHHELTVLAAHLITNLLLPSDDVDSLSIPESMCYALEKAMRVRRLGESGNETVDGVLAQLAGTPLGQILQAVEASEDMDEIELGFLFLMLDIDTINKINLDLSKAIKEPIIGDSDFSILLPKHNAGLTVHSNNHPRAQSYPHLNSYCEIKKYIEKTESWFGVCISPGTGIYRFAIKNNLPWEYSDGKEIVAKEFVRLYKPTCLTST